MRIFLRPISEGDTFNIVKWRNSEKVRMHCMTKAPITIESSLKFYKQNVTTGKYMQYIVERVEEETGLVSYPIATVYLKDMDYENKRCELCIFTSDDVEWGAEGQAIAIKMLLKKAFEDLNMHKVYTYVFEKYPDEIQLMTESGFVKECMLQGESLDENGIYENVIRLCIFNK